MNFIGKDAFQVLLSSNNAAGTAVERWEQHGTLDGIKATAIYLLTRLDCFSDDGEKLNPEDYNWERIPVWSYQINEPVFMNLETGEVTTEWEDNGNMVEVILDGELQWTAA